MRTDPNGIKLRRFWDDFALLKSYCVLRVPGAALFDASLEQAFPQRRTASKPGRAFCYTLQSMTNEAEDRAGNFRILPGRNIPNCA
jgi:hypothetical protein